MVSLTQTPAQSISSHVPSTNAATLNNTANQAARNAPRVDIGHAEPTKAEKASAFLSGTVVGMRGAVRGFVLAPSAFIVQTALGTANILLEGVTDVLFQVAKKGGLQEISNGNTHFSEILRHNFEHEHSELADNKPYGYYLANDAKTDFQRAQDLFNRESRPTAFDVKTINLGKTETGENKGIVQLNSNITAHFSSHNRDKLFQLGEVQTNSQQRALHFLKHSGLATVDLIKATTRFALAIGIAGTQGGKALGIFLVNSTVDISFALLKKGGLEEFAQRRSNIREILRHNYERHAQQIADKPYANILAKDALHDLYSLITNLKSAVAFGDAETVYNPNIPADAEIANPDTQQPLSNHSLATPTDPANATHHNIPLEISVDTNSSEQNEEATVSSLQLQHDTEDESKVSSHAFSLGDSIYPK